MVPCSFDGENVVLQTPPGFSSDALCATLNAFYGENDHGLPFLISCWKLTKQEVEDLTTHGRLWLVVAGNNHPPMALSTVKPPVIAIGDSDAG